MRERHAQLLEPRVRERRDLARGIVVVDDDIAEAGCGRVGDGGGELAELLRGEIADVHVVAPVSPALGAVAVVGRRRREAERGLLRPRRPRPPRPPTRPSRARPRCASRQAPGCRGRPRRRRSARARAPAACRREAPRRRGRCRPSPQGPWHDPRRGRAEQPRATARGRALRAVRHAPCCSLWQGAGRPVAHRKESGAMRRVPAIVACLLATFLLATPALADSRSSDLRVATTTKIDTLNPLVGTLASEYRVWALNYDILIGFDAKSMRPDRRHSLAAGWNISRDGLTWTYHLRRGLRWSDGQPLTAHDVVWTMDFMRRRIGPSGVEAVKSWEAPNDTTVVAHLSHRSVEMNVAVDLHPPAARLEGRRQRELRALRAAAAARRIRAVHRHPLERQRDDGDGAQPLLPARQYGPGTRADDVLRRAQRGRHTTSSRTGSTCSRATRSTCPTCDGCSVRAACTSSAHHRSASSTGSSTSTRA